LEFLITTISLSSIVINSLANLLKAFISLAKKVSSFQIHKTIGLPSFAPTKISGFSLSITAIEYAQTSFFITFSTVDFKSFSNKSSKSFAITSVSV
jgi:hypothetical protein